MNKTKLKKEILELFKKQDFKNHLNKEIDKLLNSGYLEIESYNFKEDGYQLPKLCLYVIFKRIAFNYKPFDTQFMKQYKSLIKNY